MRKSSVSISLIFHAMAFIMAVVSIPWLKKDIVTPPPVSVEMVTIDELNQTTKVAPKPEKKIEKKIEKPPAPPKPAPAPTNLAKEMTKPVKDDKKEDPVKKEEKVLVDPNAHPDKKMTKKEEKKKQVTQTDEEKMRALLKNLAEEKPTPKPDEKLKDLKLDEPAPPDEGRPVPLGARMTMTEMDALRSQLEGCWNVPSGAKGADSMSVDVFMVINRDRTLQAARVVDESRYSRDSFFRALADSAMRAVRSPNCSPFELPPDKYDTWKQITVTFDPSQMF